MILTIIDKAGGTATVRVADIQAARDAAERAQIAGIEAERQVLAEPVPHETERGRPVVLSEAVRIEPGDIKHLRVAVKMACPSCGKLHFAANSERRCTCGALFQCGETFL